MSPSQCPYHNPYIKIFLLLYQMSFDIPCQTETEVQARSGVKYGNVQS